MSTPVISAIQTSFSNTVATVLCFDLRTGTTATKSGAKEGILQPLSHACYQNNVDVPSPRTEYVTALKQVVVIGSSLHGRTPIHAMGLHGEAKNSATGGPSQTA
jgi:hypothetical protein